MYRVGGDEFLVVLPGVDLPEGVAVAERLRQAVAETKPAGLEVTISLGVGRRLRRRGQPRGPARRRRPGAVRGQGRGPQRGPRRRPRRPRAAARGARRSRRLAPRAQAADPPGAGVHSPAPMDYPVENFTAEERAAPRARISPIWTRPVFALVNLPETVKGALFARYSRYGGTLRRLFLDEFADDLPSGAGADLRRRGGTARGAALRADLPGLRRRLGGPARRGARGLRVGLERDDQGAAAAAAGRLPGAVDALHRLRRADGRRRRLPLLARSGARPGVRARDGRAVLHLCLRAAAGGGLGRDRFPRADGEPEAAHRRSIRAKALDLLRGLLPAASLSHMGMFATGQTYEQLVLHLLASPLPEARFYGDQILGSSRRWCRAS